MNDLFADLRRATASALRDGPSTTPASLRRAVADGHPPDDLRAFVQKIRTRAYAVTDADVNALRARYSEDQIFEIIVAAALGAAEDRLGAAHRALEDA